MKNDSKRLLFHDFVSRNETKYHGYRGDDEQNMNEPSGTECKETNSPANNKNHGDNVE
jgi:hypothetical protein